MHQQDRLVNAATHRRRNTDARHDFNLGQSHKRRRIYEARNAIARGSPVTE